MMNNKIGIVKKLTAGMLAAGMILTGIVVPSQQVDAEGTVTIKDTVIYDDSYNIKDYWEGIRLIGEKPKSDCGSKQIVIYQGESQQ